MANNPYDTLDEVPVVEEKKVQPEPVQVETVKPEPTPVQEITPATVNKEPTSVLEEKDPVLTPTTEELENKAEANANWLDDEPADEPISEPAEPAPTATVEEPVKEEQPQVEEPVETTPAADDDLFDAEADENEQKNKIVETQVYLTQPRDVDIPEGYAENTGKKWLSEPFKIKNVIDDTNEDYAIYTLRGTQQSVYAALERVKDSFFEQDPAAFEKWWSRLSAAQGTYMLHDDQYFDITTRGGAKWRNMLNHGTEESPLYKGLINERGLGKSTSNDSSASFNLLSGLLKLGMSAYTPLYHTGIWVKLRAPTAASFIRLDETIASDKVDYGMRTRGDIFSNDAAIVRKHIADFVLDHIESTTAPKDDPDYLKTIIKVEDLNTLMLAMMKARYPDGYPLVQVCSVDPNECSHTTEGLVDLRSLLWVDTTALSARQYAIINNVRKRITEEQLQEYQDEFRSGGKGVIHLSTEEVVDDNIVNGVTINIEMPTLAKEEDYAVNWIRDTEHEIEELFREKNNPEDRRRKWQDIINTNYFKTYGQYIRSIAIIEAGRKVKEFDAERDPDEIDRFFEIVSGEYVYTQQFFKALKKYMAENVVSVVGILNYECPNCGKKHDTRPGKHHIVLPIDMVSTFFTLVRSSVRASSHRINM